MAHEPIWSEADITNLKNAIASGVLSVRYDGPPARQVTYHSLKDMRELLAEMIRDVRNDGGSGVRYAQTSKGF